MGCNWRWGISHIIPWVSMRLPDYRALLLLVFGDVVWLLHCPWVDHPLMLLLVRLWRLLVLHRIRRLLRLLLRL